MGKNRDRIMTRVDVAIKKKHAIVASDLKTSASTVERGGASKGRRAEERERGRTKGTTQDQKT